MAREDHASAKARKLVKQLHDATASAEDLAKTVAAGIRNERAAGLPYKPLPPHTAVRAKATTRRTTSKKR